MIEIRTEDFFRGECFQSKERQIKLCTAWAAREDLPQNIRDEAQRRINELTKKGN